MKIQLDNIKLRKWEISDVDNLVRYADNYAISDYLTNKFPHPYTRENGLRFIEFANAHDQSIVFAITYDGGAIGGIGVHGQDDVYEKNAELGYWVAEPFWGQGIATRVIPQIIEKAFQQLEIERIYARPFGSNIGSQRVLEKCGFVKEAHIPRSFYKNGRYEDELIYAVRRYGR